MEGGDVLVLMAVIDAGCGGGGGVSHGSRRCWLWGEGESGVPMAVEDTGCLLVTGRGPPGSPRHWLWKEVRGWDSHGSPRR